VTAIGLLGVIALGIDRSKFYVGTRALIIRSGVARNLFRRETKIKRVDFVHQRGPYRHS